MASVKSADLFNVNGQVIVITGGGTGIGAMMAKALAQNGARRVYILGRRMDKLVQMAEQNSVEGNIVPIQCDVTSQDQLAAAAKQVQDRDGFVNVVIANSGISGPQITALPESPSIAEFQRLLWEKHTMQAYTDTYHMNVTSAFFTLVAFMLLLDAGNTAPTSPTAVTGVKSQFVVTSSIAGFNRRATAGFAYGSSKAAVNHLMKQMAVYLTPYHIRVNVICPGLYPSEMTADRTDMSTDEGSIPMNVVPATRMGSEQDMAGNILFLCGRAGAYLNSNLLISDGGRLAQMPGTY